MHDAEIRVKTKVDTSEFSKFGTAMEQTKEILGKSLTLMRNMGTAIKNVFVGGISFIANFIKAFTTMLLKVTLLGLIVKGVRAGIKLLKEGLEEFYEASPEYKKAVDDFKQSLTDLKASMASAFAPIIMQILPYLQQLVDWLARACDAIAMFMAYITGKSVYLKAKKGVAGYSKELSGATKNAKELNKQLSSIDELNVLHSQKETANGGGGSGAGGSGSLWEEAEVDPTKFKWLDWIKDHLELIKELALAIGSALLAWKIGRALGMGLKEIAGLALAIYSAFHLVEAILDQWKNGVTLGNFQKALASAVGLAVGLGLAFGVVGLAVGMAVGGLTLIASALADISKKGKMTGESFMQITSGITLAWGQMGLFLESIALTFAVVKKLWQKFKDAVQEIKNCKGAFAELKATTDNWITKLLASLAQIVQAIVRIITGIKDMISSAFSSIVTNLGSIKTVGTGGFAMPKLQLATGGIVTAPTTALIGEAGREVVLPLESNTEWMDALADRISNTVIFRVENDSDRLLKIVQIKANDYTNRTGKPAFKS